MECLQTSLGDGIDQTLLSNLLHFTSICPIHRNQWSCCRRLRTRGRHLCLIFPGILPRKVSTNHPISPLSTILCSRTASTKGALGIWFLLLTAEAGGPHSLLRYYAIPSSWDSSCKFLILCDA